MYTQRYTGPVISVERVTPERVRPICTRPAPETSIFFGVDWIRQKPDRRVTARASVRNRHRSG